MVAQEGGEGGKGGNGRGRKGGREDKGWEKEGIWGEGKAYIMVDCMCIGSDCSVSGYPSALSHRDHEL